MCVCVFTMQINNGIHIISKMKPVMWPGSAKVSTPGCTSWTFTHMGGGRRGSQDSDRGGWQGSERAGLRARGGWCHKLLSTATPDDFRVYFHTVKAATVAVVCIATA